MAVIKKPKQIDKHSVGCILLYKSKYILFHRRKDNLWGSLSGSVKKTDNDYNDAIKREIQEEIGLTFLTLNPSYFTTGYHNYDNKFVAYHLFFYKFVAYPLFFYKFKSNPTKKIKLLYQELNSFDMFGLLEALNLNLFEDEDYCLKLFEKKQK